MVGEYHHRSEQFTAGQLRFYKKAWEEITSDNYILQMVSGYRLEFSTAPPKQMRLPRQINCSEIEKLAIAKEIERLLVKDVIEISSHETNEFLSNVFARAKKDGGLRMILNLRELNLFIEYHHFKMDTLSTGLKLITPGCFMASIDLRDAYYSVPIHVQDHKYLKFMWENTLYKFKALPNGLTSGPRMFTKLLKPPFSVLRKKGHIITGYIDDTLLIAKDIKQTQRSVIETCNLLTKLGFVIHPKKSVFVPCQEITFLGFVLNSVTMTVRLTDEKKKEIWQLCKKLPHMRSPSIRHVAGVIGKIVATFPGVECGRLHYRELEKDRNEALTKSKGNYDVPMVLSAKARTELLWWSHNIMTATAKIARQAPDVWLETDASGSGWGAFNGKERIGGRWNREEIQLAASHSINYMEMWAAFLALQAFFATTTNCHILLRMDNTTAVAYLNDMGGIKSQPCNELAKRIWQWCTERGCWLTAAYLPGKANVIADAMSRKFNDQIEWQLNVCIFNRINDEFGPFEIDLFASRLNKQLGRYCAWKPDPAAVAVDAFSVDWTNKYFYAFPPFCLVG